MWLMLQDWPARSGNEHGSCPPVPTSNTHMQQESSPLPMQAWLSKD